MEKLAWNGPKWDQGDLLPTKPHDPNLKVTTEIEFDNLIDVLHYLEKIGFKVKKESDSSIRILAIPSGMGWGDERKIIREIIDHFLNEV